MPEGPDGKTIIIVKKVSGHAAHHGGAWKVAYADFVTAMMALFMVLWLVNSAAEPTRQRIASYFRKPGVFQEGSGTPLEIGGGGILPDTFAPPAEANSQIITSKKIYQIDAQSGKIKEYFDPSTGKKGDIGLGEGMKELNEEKFATGEGDVEGDKIDVDKLKSELEKAVGEGQQSGQRSGLMGEVDIKVDSRGLMIEIMDTDKASMFQLGQATILPKAAAQLREIASVLKEIPNPIDVEGHTDGRPYRGKNANTYDNWDLSLERANSARRVLQAVGLSPEKIARVVGYADRRPKNVEDPFDPSNRRITISMRFTEQAKTQLDGTSTVETEPQPLLEQERGNRAKQKVSKAAQRPEEAVGEEKKPKKAIDRLRVEVGTTMPEGTVIRRADEPAVRPTQVEKDKIFGPGNGFFTR